MMEEVISILQNDKCEDVKKIIKTIIINIICIL
jgi:hypothetical protein